MFNQNENEEMKLNSKLNSIQMEARNTISNMQYVNNSFFDRERYLWKGSINTYRSAVTWCRNGRKFRIPPQNSVHDNNDCLVIS